MLLLLRQRIIITTPLISIVAAATSVTAFTKGTNRKTRHVIRKVKWLNRAGANSYLTIGYTSLGAAFVPVAPNILMLNNIDGILTEDQLPQMGNDPNGGFVPDATAGTGTLGDIILRASVAGAAPADVQVQLDVEEVNY